MTLIHSKWLQDTTEVGSLITAEHLSATGNHQKKLVQSKLLKQMRDSPKGLSTLANIAPRLLLPKSVYLRLYIKVNIFRKMGFSDSHHSGNIDILDCWAHVPF